MLKRRHTGETHALDLLMMHESYNVDAADSKGGVTRAVAQCQLPSTSVVRSFRLMLHTYARGVDTCNSLGS